MLVCSGVPLVHLWKLALKSRNITATSIIKNNGMQRTWKAPNIVIVRSNIERVLCAFFCLFHVSPTFYYLKHVEPGQSKEYDNIQIWREPFLICVSLTLAFDYLAFLIGEFICHFQNLFSSPRDTRKLLWTEKNTIFRSKLGSISICEM